MRAMIQAAGLGTRLRPLTFLRPKTALPVRGLPVIAYALAWLARQGVTEAVINLHHLPDAVQAVVARYRPPELAVRFSNEPTLLGTGGALRQVAEFLRESDPSLVIAGDMILDLELAPIVSRHRARGDLATLVLRDDPRAAEFGSLGLDAAGRLRRIGRRFDLGGEQRSGLYTSVRLLAARAFETLPAREVFVDLDDWLAPRLAAGADDIRGERLARGDGVWEPAGRPAEYLHANLEPAALSYLDADARARAEGTRFEKDVVIGAGATLGEGARLRRAVVWDGERVPAGFDAHDGVFAGGRFHSCGEAPAGWR